MAFLQTLTACGERADAPPRPPPAAAGMLSAEWIYTPADVVTREATGAVTVSPGVGAEGPERTVAGARGGALRAVLSGEADPAMAKTLAGRSGAQAMVYVVAGGNLCAGAQATHVVWYEPELIEGRTLALALLTGPPGETGSTICRVLRYTRERSRAGDSEGAR